MTTTATNALTARPRRRAPVWISIFNTCTAAVVLWFYALPSGVWFAVLYALLLVVSAVTVWALASNRPRLAQLLLGATVLLALPAAAIWIAVLAFIALAILTRTVRAARSGWRSASSPAPTVPHPAAAVPTGHHGRQRGDALPQLVGDGGNGHVVALGRQQYRRAQPPS